MAKSKRQEIHPVAKKHGYSSNEEFYKDFPFQEDYENWLKMGGQLKGGKPCLECGGMLHKYNSGGEMLSIIAPALSAIPGAGVPLSIGASILGGILSNTPSRDKKPQSVLTPMMSNPNKYGFKHGGLIPLTGVGEKKENFIPMFGGGGGRFKGIGKNEWSFDSGLSPWSDEDVYLSPNYKRNFISDDNIKSFNSRKKQGVSVVPYFKASATAFPFSRSSNSDLDPKAMIPNLSGEVGGDFYHKNLKVNPYIGYNFNGMDPGQYGGLNVDYTLGNSKSRVNFPVGFSVSSDSKRGTFTPHVGFNWKMKNGEPRIRANFGYDVVEHAPVGSIGVTAPFKDGGFHINPKHKGWCTPMTKSTCTGKRRTFALNAKHHFKKWKHEDGGEIMEDMNNGDIQKYSGPLHEQGGINVNGIGVPVNNPNNASAEVEGGETSIDNYIFSDTLGFTKDGEVTYTPKKVKTTFAKVSKKIDKKFGGRTDEISKVTKNLAYSTLINKNEEALKNKFHSALNRFQKKYGGDLLKYTNGGINPMEFPEDYMDYIKVDNTVSPIGGSYSSPQLRNTNFLNLDNIPPPELDYEKTYIPPVSEDLFTPEGTQVNLTPSYGIMDTFEKPSIPNIKKGINWNKVGNATIDLAPVASNLGFALESAFSKSRNYREHLGPEEELTYQALNPKPDVSANLAQNFRTYNAANKYSSIYTPSVGNSIRSQNLSNRLYASNDIYSKANELQKQLEFQKAGMIGNAKYRRNVFNQEGEHQFTVENEQDRQARLEGLQTNLNAGLKNLQDTNYNKEVLNLLPQGWQFINWDPDSRTFKARDVKGDLWSINTVTKQKTKVS